MIEKNIFKLGLLISYHLIQEIIFRKDKSLSVKDKDNKKTTIFAV
jgi:hypothetical protein